MSVKGFNTENGVEKYDYEALENLPKDTGWVDVELNSVKVYNDIESNTPKVRRIGSKVYLKGAVSPTEAATELIPAFTIPEGFRPVGLPHVFIEQGSGSNRFCLDIRNTGEARIYRYSNDTTASNEIPTNAWLNCFAEWLVD